MSCFTGETMQRTIRKIYNNFYKSKNLPLQSVETYDMQTSYVFRGQLQIGKAKGNHSGNHWTLSAPIQLPGKVGLKKLYV